MRSDDINRYCIFFKMNYYILFLKEIITTTKKINNNHGIL